MFRLVEQTDKAPVIMEFYVKNNEAIAEGECLVFANGRLTKASAGGGAVAAVSLHSVEAGIDKTCKVHLVLPGQVWETTYIGDPDAGFVVGCATADIDNTGTMLNAAAVTLGPCAIIAIDGANAKAKVVFKNRQLS